MQEAIGLYIQERIDCAGTAIVQNASTKIANGDVILVYGFSEVISKVLVMQQELIKDFRVIVVDSRPLLEGRIMLETLRKEGISCTYILLQCLPYVMKDVTKVLLGAAAVMGDGSAQGRVGTACVAMMAQGKPVLVCCETYKVTTRMQLESMTDNELGDPSELNDDKQKNLQVFSPLYDLTPSEYISGFVTESGILPTLASMLLRETDL
jgi:translation initiation factor eIF-2B subunit delta